MLRTCLSSLNGRRDGLRELSLALIVRDWSLDIEVFGDTSFVFYWAKWCRSDAPLNLGMACFLQMVPGRCPF